MTLIDYSNISPRYRTDYSLLEHSISMTLKKGKNFENSVILRYRMRYLWIKLKTIIYLLKEHYAVSTYNRANITTINNEIFMFNIGYQSFFEQVLLEIRGMTITYSSLKKKEAESRKKQLGDPIRRFQHLRHNNVPQNPYIEEQLQKKNMRKEHIKGLLICKNKRKMDRGWRKTNKKCLALRREITLLKQ